MTITFYNQLNDNRVVSKNLGEALHSAECTPLGECSIQNPVIMIRQFNGYATVNYCYISDYGRYYYITEVIAHSGDLLEIRCKVDVLMSFGDVIRQCTGVCTANERIGTSYVVDKNLPLDTRKVMSVAEFSDSDFNQDSANELTHNFVINVAGGESEEPEPEPGEE